MNWKVKKHFENTELNEENKDNSNSIEDKVITRRELEKIKEEIISFKEPDRSIFIQRFFLNKSVKDIASALSITPKAVSLRILRGREKLSKHFKGNSESAG